MNRQTTIDDCVIIELPKIYNRAGHITALNNTDEIPFEVKRIYYLYDVPSGVERGGHAHHKLHQYLVAASGSFDVIIDDGNIKKTVSLNRPNFALKVVPGIWRELNNFSSGSICLVLASEKYDEGDYIRNHDEFLTYKKNGK